jgi:hypothetical protein
MKEATNVDKVTTNKATFKKIVCPFDLDAVFSLQYSVSGLKSVLEFIIENLDSSSVQFSDLSEAMER